MNLLILGAGGHGQVVAELAEELGQYGSIAFLDDAPTKSVNGFPWSILGPISELARYRTDFAIAFVAVGDSKRRLQLLSLAESGGYAVATLVHAAASVSRRAELEVGTVVCAGAVVQVNARLGRGCIVNTCASVDHGCILGAGVHVCPGAHLAGSVVVGEHTWIGIGASVRQGLSIGKGVTVGAGAAVVDDVEDESTVVGVPARHQSRS